MWNLSNFEIIILIIIAIIVLHMTWLTYSFRKDRATKQTEKEIGRIQQHCESTTNDMVEVKTDVRKLTDKVDNVHNRIDGFSESLRKEILDVRNVSTAAHRQIGNNIDTVRSDFKREIGRVESEFKKDIGRVEESLTKSEERLIKSIDEIKDLIVNNRQHKDDDSDKSN